MANVDWPHGFRFAYTKHGGPPRLTKHLSTAAAIYPGDLVKKDGSGRILTITAASDNPIGVAASYCAATADSTVYVYDDLAGTIFECQADDASLADDTQVGNFFDVVVTTGDTTTLQSKHELDGNASAEDTLTLVGLYDTPGNAWGANARVYVQVRVDANAEVIATT